MKMILKTIMIAMLFSCGAAFAETRDIDIPPKPAAEGQTIKPCCAGGAHDAPSGDVSEEELAAAQAASE